MKSHAHAHITRSQAKKLAEEYKINTDIVSVSTLMYGLNVEMEHSDISHRNLETTMKIVLAHLKEYPDYYKRLKSMEKRADKYYSDKKKPSIFV